jgi:enoyl-CoA hydratase
MEMALTGGLLSADRAYAMGLLNRLVPTGEARRTAVELAQQIARNAPLAVAASKQMIEQAQHTPEEEMFVLQDAVAAQIMASADAHEGAVAFSEKREPVWSGQ